MTTPVTVLGVIILVLSLLGLVWIRVEARDQARRRARLSESRRRSAEARDRLRWLEP